MSTEFLCGATTVLVAGLVYKIWSLLQAPSVASIERLCRQPLPTMGDDSKVTVWGFERKGHHKHWKDGISDDSNYVGRVEAYLRLIGQEDYEKKTTTDLRENPRGKVPFCNIQGIMVDDSARILETIQNTFHVTVDDHLTAEQQQTTGHLIRQLLCGSLYWVMLHQKFETERGRQAVVQDFSKVIPPVIRNFVLPMVFRNMRSSLRGCGVGLLSHAEICKKGQADVRALSQLLGTHQYFLGSPTPTSYDTDVYAWLVLLFYDESQVSNPWVVEIQEECPNLVAHTERMKKLLYPELYNSK